MPRKKTTLTPEQQWNSTVKYAKSCAQQEMKQDLRAIYEASHRENRPLSDDELANVRELEEDLSANILPSSRLWVVSTPHPLLNLGDVLFVTCPNGMVQRFGMTGVSSKGARLNHYFIPLRKRYNAEVELPGDLIDLRCDDPAIGRFVADLRASSRRRVGASIPAPTQIADRIEASHGLRFDGCYRSRRGPRHKRTEHFDRNYLRFFPDGTVVVGPDGGFNQWNRERFVGGACHGTGRRGTYSVDGDSIFISLLLGGKEVDRYEGTICGERLRLSRCCRQGWAESRKDDVYNFGAWK